ncbi:hypothetical protein [Bacteroides sp.]|uniref:hypothetical protein n=1 Tax=Bacteroides sp. TaxID=29523 RepID=UPI0026161658|nr:hypothetical protein [Bacteroides sp.]MDD3040643.1 hypothetical protein [Bacteroides sp.]
MAVIIQESGMTFGPFANEHCFWIEKSAIYGKIQGGVKIAEFILLQPDQNSLFVLEAKTSSPNPQNGESRYKFEDYITEIAEKLLNALTLGVTSCLERHIDIKNEVPIGFKNLAYNSLKIILILVIKDHKQEWLSPVNDALKKKLAAAIKTWPLNIIVLNESLARRNGLLINT